MRPMNEIEIELPQIVLDRADAAYVQIRQQAAQEKQFLWQSKMQLQICHRHLWKLERQPSQDWEIPSGRLVHMSDLQQ